ncbi:MULTISPECIES: hypothetical protein [Rhodococcus]|uniref:hypothetical protein n=1 Tax=Rhodococcus TaxID=1827 RepID=UPI0004C32A84|nr:MULTISPECIES: hypothetical protein [Rhodococcus]MCJ0950364.1 hypothetical protein [Rhodococcus sp. ARC_M8]QEX10876.1 hypothetical protein F6X56_14705 [Rhodococcus erythropolis]UKO88888.1 hypothetical protein ITJ47_14220 [Rhodococcus erythropolis]BBE45472.1 hypothetical protein RE2895_24030 [Rhodococcus erythropolis]
MITRSTFIAILDAIERQRTDDDRIGAAIDQLAYPTDTSANNNGFAYVTPLNDNLLAILADELNDEYGYINWWIYDGPDWGRKAEEYAIATPDGQRVAIRDAGELWDWLICSAS